MTHLSSSTRSPGGRRQGRAPRSELPETTAQFDLLDSGDRTTIDLDENWF